MFASVIAITKHTRAKVFWFYPFRADHLTFSPLSVLMRACLSGGRSGPGPFRGFRRREIAGLMNHESEECAPPPSRPPQVRIVPSPARLGPTSRAPMCFQLFLTCCSFTPISDAKWRFTAAKARRVANSRSTSPLPNGCAGQP